MIDIVDFAPRRILVPWGPGRNYVPTGTGGVVHGHGCITYSEAYETTGSATASVTIFDGNNANGQQLMDYNLASGESTSEILGLHWLTFEEGIHIVTNSGSAAGSITAWVDHDCAAYNGAMYQLSILARIELALRIENRGGQVPSIFNLT